MSPIDVLWRLGLVLLLVLANAFFVASEYALVSVRPTRLDQLIAQGNRVARRVRRAREDPSRFLATTQLGVTVASLLLGWIGEETFAGLILVPLEALLPATWVAAAAHTVASVLALALITLLHVTLGEQVPKLLALQRAEATILFTIRPFQFTATLFRPLSAVFYLATGLVLRLLGLQFNAEDATSHTPEELRLLVRHSARAWEEESAQASEILDRVFTFANLTAAEVMIPRTEAVAIPVEATLDDVVQCALRQRFSRFPVYERSLDNIVGVLLVKDLLPILIQTPQPRFSVRRVMRPPVLVPATLPALEVMGRMRSARAPLAVVLDEYGGTDGIVTLKDLLGRVVGEVGDEYVHEQPGLRRLPDGSLLADGLLLVDEFNERVGAHLDSSEVDTLGGLALARLGRMAAPGDEVDLGNGFRARVETLDGRRVAQLRVWPPQPSPEDDLDEEREDVAGRNGA